MRTVLAWFEQHGFAEGGYGVAEILSKAENISVASLCKAGILIAKSGKAHPLVPEELPAEWNPATDPQPSN